MKPAPKLRRVASSVVIIGAGAIGQAIAHELEKAKTRYQMWDIDPKKVPSQEPLEKILPKASIVFFCVPSWVLRPAVMSVLPFLPHHALVVAMSKGVETKTNLTIDRLFGKLLPTAQPFALLAGPMLADEIKQNLGSCALVGTVQREHFARFKKIFAGSDLELVWGPDVHGVALASILKNIYAIALGIADGLGWGGNKKGWVTACALAEMEQILKHDKASKDLLFSPAACADFIATGYSHYSRNRRVGDELVRTGMCCVQSEGLVSFSSFVEMIGKTRKMYPLLDALEAVIVRHADPRKVFDRFYHDSFKS